MSYTDVLIWVSAYIGVGAFAGGFVATRDKNFDAGMVLVFVFTWPFWLVLYTGIAIGKALP